MAPDRAGFGVVLIPIVRHLGPRAAFVSALIQLRPTSIP